jgi:hypothetical protein
MMTPILILAALIAFVESTSPSRISNEIYQPFFGSTVCTLLLDEFGEIGCSCLSLLLPTTLSPYYDFDYNYDYDD